MWFWRWRNFGGKNDALLSLLLCSENSWQPWRSAPPKDTGSNVLGLVNQHHIVHPSPSNKRFRSDSTNGRLPQPLGRLSNINMT